MSDVYRAARQFERAFLNVGYRLLEAFPPDSQEVSQLVATILYDNKNKKVKVEREVD